MKSLKLIAYDSCIITHLRKTNKRGILTSIRVLRLGPHQMIAFEEMPLHAPILRSLITLNDNHAVTIDN